MSLNYARREIYLPIVFNLYSKFFTCIYIFLEISLNLLIKVHACTLMYSLSKYRKRITHWSIKITTFSLLEINNIFLSISLTFVNPRISTYASVFTVIRKYRRVSATHQTVHEWTPCGEDRRQWSENNSVGAFPCTQPYVSIEIVNVENTMIYGVRNLGITW